MKREAFEQKLPHGRHLLDPCPDTAQLDCCSGWLFRLEEHDAIQSKTDSAFKFMSNAMGSPP